MAAGGEDVRMGKRYVPPFLRSPEDDLVLTEALPPEDQLAGRFERTKLAAAANPECKPAASRQAQGR